MTAASTMWGSMGIIVAALLTYLGVRFSSRSSEKAAQHTVQADAYTKALTIWETSVAQLTKDVQRLSQDLETARRDLDAARAEIRGLVNNRQTWERREALLEARVRRLEQELLAHGVTPPPWEQATGA